MKKFLFAALVTLFITSSSFAEGGRINNTIKNNFSYDFKGVSEVEWSTTASYATASFILNNKRTNAFYDNDGQLIGTIQAISIDEMPASAKRSFAKKYADYTVVESINFTTATESTYFISAKKDENKVVLKVSNGFLSVVK
ncbi:hypothetical protein [Aridibaculum aurantiacum]|uniref:hypothetical protein n=1 Tax=Aridibaculum aurantiacum TaxID=2810307 RepID=UPI001A962791|nr:hypothetical protein [Aridibaculum aurantiacum]